MQVLQRLFKLVQDKQSNTTNKNEITDQAKEGKSEIIHSNNQRPRRKPRKRESINLDCNEFNKNLAALIRRQHLKALFSNTLYIYSVKIKKDDIIRCHKKSVDQSASSSPSTTHNVRNKVLPVSDTSATSSSTSPKAKSKMKELVKWYAASKSHKGGKQTGIKVSHFRKGERANVISESPKISLSLINPERFSTVGSDECHLGDGKGNWITTTDDEFVVLEL